MPITALCSLQSILLAAAPIGETLHVPADYSTIQACIDAAVSGVDECVVAPGTYNETINFLGKAITLRSSGGANVTTIDAPGYGTVVVCVLGEGPNTVLEGFTITGSPSGGMSNHGSNPTVKNCTFSGNTGHSGGGMRNTLSSPTVSGCTFKGKNSAPSSQFEGGLGGGMFNESASPIVTNCTFNGNSAVNGGAMFNIASNVTISDCIFRGNTGTYSGGIVNFSSTLTITNTTFCGNKSLYSPGGGLLNAYGNLTATNCIFWGDGLDEIEIVDSNPTIRFSDLQGGLPVGAVDGGGNIDLDPMFVRPPNPGPDGMWDGVDDDYGDLRLLPGSPCINAGDPAFVAQPGETDLDGHARVLCERVDMGAYEFGIGDFDCDQTVNLTDFAHWSACATGPQATALAGEPPVAPSCEPFDFDADGDVDLFDFTGFATAATGVGEGP